MFLLCIWNHLKPVEVVEEGLLKKIDSLQKDLREKEESLEELDAHNQCLIYAERLKNDELQEARKELISVSLCTGIIWT